MKTTAYDCDRCGVDCTIDPGRNRLALVAGLLTRGPRPEEIDLCGPCTSGLVDWLESPPPRGNQKDERVSLAQ
jgi:hypothetical protein